MTVSTRSNMSFHLDWRDFFEDLGSGVGGAVSGVADQFELSKRAVAASCKVVSFDPRYRNYTGYAKGFWRSACSKGGFDVPPPTDGSLFLGGQCADKEYRVTVSFTLFRCAGSVVVGEDSDATVTNTGKVLGVDIGIIPSVPSFSGVYVTFERSNGELVYGIVNSTTRGVSSDNCQTTTGNGSVGDAIDLTQSRAAIVNVSTVDGSPDDCGNSDGSEQKDREFDFQPTGELDVTTFINGGDTNINAGIAFVGGDVTVVVSTGGIDITQGGGSGGGGGGAPEGEGEGEGGGGGSTTTTTLLPDKDSEEFITKKFPGEEEEEKELEELEVEDEEVDWVLVEITTPPRSGKTILQKAPENNDYFAGYFSWVVTDGNAYWLEQQPIRKQYTAFKAPEAVSGYRMYAVNGAKLAARQYIQIIKGEQE